MRARVFALIPLLVYIAPALDAQTAQTAQPTVPAIEVTGTAEARVVPDRATVFIGVRTRAATAAAAAQENARKQRAILDTLRAAGLPNEQIKTADYTVAPETRYDNATQTTHVTGYTVSNTIVAEVRRIEQVSTVIDAALAKGSNQISALQFYSSVADSVRRAALAEATINARREAEVLAMAAGGTLGPLLELSSQTPMIRPFTTAMSAMAMGARADTMMPTPIEAGEQTISATVSARWAFKAGSP